MTHEYSDRPARERTRDDAAPHEHGPRGHGGHGFGGPMGMWRGFSPFAPPFGRGRGGPRARRGNIRAAVLLLLEEAPRNGYQMMQEVEERSQGVWRPSPGSIYPALQQLSDEGLIEPNATKLFALTAEGRTHVEAHREEFGLPWETVGESVGENVRDARSVLSQTAMALMQVMQVGSAAQIEAARVILVDARKRLYQILSEDDE